MSSMPNALAANLRVTYDDLLRTLSLLEAGEVERASLETEWTPKALLAHVAFWDRTQTRRLRDVLAGVTAATGFARPASTNDTRAQADAALPLDAILTEVEHARAGLIGLTETLTPAQLETSYREGDSWLTPGRLIAHMANHTRQHERELWRYCGSMRRWTRAGLRVFLARQDANLMDSIGGLSEATLVTPGVIGDWSLRDVLVHILAWREYGYRVAKQWPQIDKDSLAPWLEDATEDAVNAQLLTARAALNMIDIADGLTTYHRRMLKLLDQASDAQLASIGDPGQGEPGELSGFVYGLTLHEMEHAEEIWRFRVIN
ncbi:MAG: DinB family protein [Anaerolineales bacterium]|nr:DinB family protein [Anaerolineales bacterium]